MIPLAVAVATLCGGVSLSAPAPRAARLLDEGALAQVAPPAPVVPPAEPAAPPVSLAQLQVDSDALRKLRPSLGPPITLVAIGGSGVLIGALYVGLAVGFAGGFGPTTTIFLIMGGVFAGVGAPMAVIGAWLLINRLGERTRIDAELKALRQQMDALQNPAAPRDAPPPPPPPQVEGPRPGLLLAVF